MFHSSAFWFLQRKMAIPDTKKNMAKKPDAYIIIVVPINISLSELLLFTKLRQISARRD